MEYPCSPGKLSIECEEPTAGPTHPHCPHGPTLLFTRGDKGERYYGCAAFRDKRLCSFHLPQAQVTKVHLKRRYPAPAINYCEKRMKFMNSDSEQQRHYCYTCNEPLLDDTLAQHRGHEVVRNLDLKLLRSPSEFLRPLDNDKAQAQYFFDQKALNFFAKCFRDLGINQVICMGAPRLHEHLRNNCADIKSFLLDFDQRFFFFYGNNEFAWYNMCNNHFFDEQQERSLLEFLKCAKDSARLLIFTDPPFGCRTEPIAHTLRSLTCTYNKINRLVHQPLPIFWIFPYFAEHYIKQVMPEMEMCAYKVNYTNHLAYTNIGDKCRKLGSPVRVFTNVPLERIKLPVEQEYKYCKICDRYTALENRHCFKCGVCPAKNGSVYRHCNFCGKCVKPNYVHCARCRRCTQLEGHNCEQYQLNQRCWICLQVGHTELGCKAWFKHCGKPLRPAQPKNAKEIICLLCGRGGHNEQQCNQRAKILTEETFLGETKVYFKSLLKAFM